VVSFIFIKHVLCYSVVINSAMELMFSVVCWFVCLLARSVEKLSTDYHETWWIGWTCLGDESIMDDLCSELGFFHFL